MDLNAVSTHLCAHQGRGIDGKVDAFSAGRGTKNLVLVDVCRERQEQRGRSRDSVDSGGPRTSRPAS